MTTRWCGPEHGFQSSPLPKESGIKRLALLRIIEAARRCVLNPAWAGVCDEDIELERALHDAGMLPEEGE